MLKIRLRRTGRKNEPHYQIVVAPHTNPVKGNFIAKLGWLNPATGQYEIDQEATLKWLNNGAKPSPRVAKLLVDLKVKHPLAKLAPQKVKAPKKKKDDTAKPTPKPETPAGETAQVSNEEVAPETDEQAAEATQEEVQDTSNKSSNDNEEA